MDPTSGTTTTLGASPSLDRRPFATDRRILWAGVLVTIFVMAVRLSAQLMHQIEANPQVQELASSLDDPALADLAVRMGVTLAVVFSTVFQIVYLFLCATVDEKLLQSVMIPSRRIDRKGRPAGLGAAVLIGIAATVPVQLVALVFGVVSPKESPFAYIWLAILVASTIAWVQTRPTIRALGARARIVAAMLLVITATISLLL